MSYKTSVNTNLYLTQENADGSLPSAPPLQPMNWVSSTLEGSYETIQSDTKLPGRNPPKNHRGTDSNAGDLVANFRPLEHDKLLEAVLCSEKGFVKNNSLSDIDHDVSEMVPGNKQCSFALLKDYTQDPKLYQLFRGLQINTLNISFTIGATVKLTFGLMGSNNPELEDTPPVSFSNKLPAITTEEFITLRGNWKFKGEDDPVPEEYIDGVDITLTITNNMTDLKGLFQKEAIDKSLGMLNITGTINEYVVDGKLYNLAKQGKGGDLYITVYSEIDDTEYTFILKISFDNSTLSGDAQLQYALPFVTYGEDRFMIRRKTKAAQVSTVNVTDVTLNTHTLDLEVGDIQQIVATVAPEDATDKGVVWQSSDENVAAVDQDGNVEAVGAGSATITVATDDGGHQDNCAVEVSEGE